MILEIKYAEDARFSSECENAMKQIESRDYTAELKISDSIKFISMDSLVIRKHVK